jgi:hypothetical protein
MLAPFFTQNDLRNIKESNKNTALALLAELSFLGDRPAFYKFYPDALEVHPDWFAYLQKHHLILTHFCYWELMQFLQARNPNIPNIGKKLSLSNERQNLGDAYQYWAPLLAQGVIKCIYSDRTLAPGSNQVDHFIPWSFIAHNQIWNLIPVTPEANLSKRNHLPDARLYLDKFCHYQYLGFKQQYSLDNKKLLEDFSFCFKADLQTINHYSSFDFTTKLKEQLTPLLQIATNAGFPSGWRYREAQ